MIHSFALQPDVTLKVERCCDCNRWFAYESGVFIGCCGHCQRARNDKMCERLQENERSMSALRGANTKLRARLKP